MVEREFICIFGWDFIYINKIFGVIKVRKVSWYC